MHLTRASASNMAYASSSSWRIFSVKALCLPGRYRVRMMMLGSGLWWCVRMVVHVALRSSYELGRVMSGMWRGEIWRGDMVK